MVDTQPECQARADDAGGMICDRCALAFDVGDTPPQCLPLNFRRMRAAMINEAERIEMSAGAAVQAGFRKFRDQAALQTAQELRGGARLVDRCLGDREIMNRLARPASKPQPKTATADTE